MNPDNTTVIQERPPEAYGIKGRYTKGGEVFVNKLEVWKAMVSCLCDLAHADWNFRIYQFPCPRNEYVAIEINGNKAEGKPPLLMKHAMWSIPEMAEWFEDQPEKIYAEAYFGIYLDGVQLGTGRIYAPESMTKENNMTAAASAGSPSNPTTKQPLSSPSIVQDSGSDSLIYANNPSDNASLSGPDDSCEVRIQFKPPAKLLCDGPTFYITIMEFLLSLGETEMSASCASMSTYSSEGDWTFKIGPTSPGAARQGILKNEMTVDALEELSKFMANVETAKRYNAYEGVFRWGTGPNLGPIVGTLFSVKGSMEGDWPEVLEIAGGDMTS